MKYYLFKDKIFKSHNKATATQYAYLKFRVKADTGKRKQEIKKQLMILRDFDNELDRG